jgi:sulfite reductase (NADPH) flavoprotein alpha-component
MLLSLFSGLYLWWPAKRMRIHRPWLSSAFWFDLHNAIGIFSLLPLLFLAGSGIVIGFEDQVSSLMGKTRVSSAMPAKPAVRALPSEHSATELTPDQAVDIARAQLPGTVADLLQMPRFGGSYQVSLVNMHDLPLGTRNSVSLDPWSGQILSTTRASDVSRGERILAWNQALHTGTAFGISSRIIVAAAGMLVPVQIVSGFWIWLRRRKIMRSSRSE